MSSDKTRCLSFVCALLACTLDALGLTPDDVMRAAGFDVDQATSETPRWEVRQSLDRPVYEIMYEFPGETMFLSVDPATSETIDIQGQPGRGLNPTSDTTTLTPQWASAKLLSLNPYKISRGLIHIGEPAIWYDPENAKYKILFPRLDAVGHQFESAAAFLHFDHATSRVTHLKLGVYLPEPTVTTRTLISREQAASIALQFLLAHKSSLFQRVPDKMTFDYIPRSIAIRVVERNHYFGDATTGTSVAYGAFVFESRLTDPSYTGRYEKMTVLVWVDVFSGTLVAGSMGKMFVGGQ